MLRVHVYMLDNSTLVFSSINEVSWRDEPGRVILNRSGWTEQIIIPIDSFYYLIQETVTVV